MGRFFNNVGKGKMQNMKSVLLLYKGVPFNLLYTNKIVKTKESLVYKYN